MRDVYFLLLIAKVISVPISLVCIMTIMTSYLFIDEKFMKIYNRQNLFIGLFLTPMMMCYNRYKESNVPIKIYYLLGGIAIAVILI